MPFDPLQRRTSSGLAFRPELTQGALVGGLRLPRYGTARHFGFLITARCDLAHIRTDTVNLLPIVPLSEWLHFDGSIAILLARLLALETKFYEIGDSLPSGIMTMIASDWKTGFDLFVAANPEVDQEIKKKFFAIIEENAVFARILSERSDSPEAITSALADCAPFRQLVAREKPKKLRALLENKIADAHFLPVVHPSEPLSQGPGYVILFRQILSIPGNTLEALKRGIASLEDLPGHLQAQACELIAPPSEVIANIRSPHVEHILQRFSTLFARVGVADCSKQYQDWLEKRIC